MRRWQNKTNKKYFRVTEWWECPPSEEICKSEGLVEVEMPDKKNRKVKTKIGILYQVGWLIENEHNVWFGVNMDAEKLFKDLGPWKEKKEKKK